MGPNKIFNDKLKTAKMNTQDSAIVSNNTSTQQEDKALTTKQTPSVQQKKMWVWKPKQSEMIHNPQPQVKPIKMIWQKKT